MLYVTLHHFQVQVTPTIHAFSRSTFPFVRTTMPVKFEEWPDAQHLIFGNEGKDRRLIFLTAYGRVLLFHKQIPNGSDYDCERGSCSDYHRHLREHDQHECEGHQHIIRRAVMPDWLQHLTDEFGGRMRFIDAYTFHVLKHIVLTKTGEIE